MQKLSGKTALITGGNSGIGLATAKLFLDHGARVIITGRDTTTLDQAKLSLGHDLITIQSDAGKLIEIESLVNKVREDFGRLDILFANAASGNVLPSELITENQFDEMTAINFKGIFFLIQKALPLLSDKSSVIVTTSISNQFGSPNFAVYAACKAALRSMAQTLSLELIGRGIRINAVSPGPTNTPGFGRWGLPQEAVQAVRDEIERKSPIKRFGTPDEVAKVVLFLASEESSYIVGSEIVVDGGMSIVL